MKEINFERRKTLSVLYGIEEFVKPVPGLLSPNSAQQRFNFARQMMDDPKLTGNVYVFLLPFEVINKSDHFKMIRTFLDPKRVPYLVLTK